MMMTTTNNTETIYNERDGGKKKVVIHHTSPHTCKSSMKIMNMMRMIIISQFWNGRGSQSRCRNFIVFNVLKLQNIPKKEKKKVSWCTDHVGGKKEGSCLYFELNGGDL